MLDNDGDGVIDAMILFGANELADTLETTLYFDFLENLLPVTDGDGVADEAASNERALEVDGVPLIRATISNIGSNGSAGNVYVTATQSQRYC